MCSLLRYPLAVCLIESLEVDGKPYGVDFISYRWADGGGVGALRRCWCGTANTWR